MDIPKVGQKYKFIGGFSESTKQWIIIKVVAGNVIFRSSVTNHDYTHSIAVFMANYRLITPLGTRASIVERLMANE